MGRKKKNFKVGESISFAFAGITEQGKIIKIEGKDKNLRYTVSDGKYTYPVSLEHIIQ
jgi:hypothetical protein